MKTHADKTQKNKSRSGADGVARELLDESSAPFFDNRPEAAAQRELKEIASDSSYASHSDTIQKMADDHSSKQFFVGKKENRTGLPDNLKEGIENLSGFSLDDVKVHYNSDKPAHLHAHAYAQGTNIHIAAGQEKHLPHEAWHVAQQKQGRVKPTMHANGIAINDDARLEKEADAIGTKAFQFKNSRSEDKTKIASSDITGTSFSQPVQRVLIGDTDITSKTPYQTIVETLIWGKFSGIGKELSNEECRALIGELKARKDCEDIVGDIEEKLRESEEENNPDESPKEVQEEFDESEFDKQAREAARKKSVDEFGWEKFPDKYKGLKKIGVHETSAKNVKGLVATGPSKEKLDTGHHLGKGPGFYVTPVGGKQLYTVVRDMYYGESFVAIYVPDFFKPINSPSSQTDNTAVLDKMFGVPDDCYYVMSGSGELVIPVRGFPSVIAVSHPKELEAIKDDESEDEDARIALVIYEEEVSFVERMNALSDRYNKAQSSSVKASIKKKWQFLETRLFIRWSMDPRRYTLWWSVGRIGEFIREPVKPF